MLFLGETFILAASARLPTTIFRAIEPSLLLVYLQLLIPFLPCLYLYLVFLAYCYALQLEATISFKTLLPIHQNAPSHDPGRL